MKDYKNKGYATYQENKDSDNDFITVSAVPFSNHHKIGISKEGFLLFFIRCDSDMKSININLELISVLFSQKCNIKEENESFKDLLSIVILKTQNEDLQKYFTDFFTIILQKIEPIPTELTLYKEVQKVIDLFSHISNPPLKSLQGLWSELLIIEKSNDPEYLIQSWHISTSDKYDFNDSKDKIEVKSTQKSRRIHRFSIDQLNNNPGSELLIASVYVEETGIGISITDLRDNILLRIKDINLKIKLNELIYKTIGDNFEKIGSIFYDYHKASNSLSYYSILNIPKIYSKDIPIEISNIKFDCDLTNIPTIIDNGYDFSNSKLFKSLGI
jgi:hypothetical protein